MSSKGYLAMSMITRCARIAFALGLATLAACSAATPPPETQGASASHIIRGQEDDRQRARVAECADDDYRNDHPVNCSVKGGSDPDADELDVEEEPPTQSGGNRRDTATKYACAYC